MRPKYRVKVFLMVECTVFAVTPTGAEHEAEAIVEEMARGRGLKFMRAVSVSSERITDEN
jgi:hypothetical protein